MPLLKSWNERYSKNFQHPHTDISNMIQPGIQKVQVCCLFSMLLGQSSKHQYLINIQRVYIPFLERQCFLCRKPEKYANWKRVFPHQCNDTNQNILLLFPYSKTIVPMFLLIINTFVMELKHIFVLIQQIFLFFPKLSQILTY